MTGHVGKAVDRVDGPAKVTGKATYSAEWDLPNMAYAVMVTSPSGPGRIVRLETRAAEDAQAAMLMNAYATGWKVRRGLAESDLATVAVEEDGARDALSRAFEELKKFEHVAEMTRLSQLKAQAAAETAALDELAGRRKKKKA